MCLFTTSQMKSLHYDQCYLYTYIHIFEIYIYIYIYIFVVSSRRNKTNPYHRNKFIPVFNATHLQAFKPKLSTYDQSWKTDQHDVSLYRYVCISWNIFNRIHVFAICDVYIICNSFVLMGYFIYMITSKVDEAASTNSFFHHIYIWFHIAIQLY